MYTGVVFFFALFLYPPARRAILFVSLSMFSTHGPIFVNCHFYVPLFRTRNQRTGLDSVNVWTHFTSAVVRFSMSNV